MGSGTGDEMGGAETGGEGRCIPESQRDRVRPALGGDQASFAAWHLHGPTVSELGRAPSCFNAPSS